MTIIATFPAVPNLGLLVHHRVPIKLPIDWDICSVLAWACDVRAMLSNNMRLEDLMPLLALGDRWRLPAYRAGGRDRGTRKRAGVEAAVPLL